MIEKLVEKWDKNKSNLEAWFKTGHYGGALYSMTYPGTYVFNTKEKLADFIRINGVTAPAKTEKKK